MTKDTVKLVLCFLTKKKGATKKAEVRFIPHAEFELWKYVMEHQHKVTVSGEDIYLWIPQMEFERKKATFARVAHIPVHKITLYFFLKNVGVLVPVTRFFKESDYQKVKPIFLKHFEEFQDENHMTKVLEHIQEEKGVCLKNI